jgi:Ubiquitin fusion degradation protein UFD1
LNNTNDKMDFDLAAKRLDRDHSRLKRDAAERKGAGSRFGGGGLGGRSAGGGVELSARARREAVELQRQARRKAEERQAKVRERDHQLEFVRQCERALKVRGLVVASSGGTTSGFLPTSIHGNGDKLALPPSALEHLTSSAAESASPWTFRVGILNPDYSFPASPLVQSMTPPPLEGSLEDDGDDDIDEDSDDDDDETSRNARSAAYLDELSHKYLAYTHGTVVEFTQDEGQVGLPRTISSALIAQIKNKTAPVRVKRTVDPAFTSTTINNNDNPMEMDVDRDADQSNEADEERTAGHLAWGAFDIPDMPVEVSLVELPKGRACTLAPTPQAVANGFYSLADVKLVLEQSLVRTRATLTVGDLVHTWNRGVQYDLHVTAVVPGTYNAVVCINTDIEVDFAPVPSTGPATEVQSSAARSGGGRTLMDSEPHPAAAAALSSPSSPGTSPNRKGAASLRPEPPAGQVEGVCVIQVRLDQLSAKRRFDVREARVADLYDFAASALLSSPDDGEVPRFRLVTRYPRRVLEPASSAGSDEDRILADVGIKSGQELVIVERL